MKGTAAGGMDELGPQSADGPASPSSLLDDAGAGTARARGLMAPPQG